MDFELTYYRHKINEAIQAPDAQTQLDRCVATLDPLFCTGITRAGNGSINGFNNTLRNLGRIDTKGYDLGVNWTGNETAIGTFDRVSARRVAVTMMSPALPDSSAAAGAGAAA